MPTPRPTPDRKPRKRLAPSEKYESFVQVLTSQATQREAADKFGVDRSTVVHICRTAKQGALDALAASVPGRPGQALEPAGTLGAGGGLGGDGGATRDGDRAGRGAAPARGKIALGLLRHEAPCRIPYRVGRESE